MKQTVDWHSHWTKKSPGFHEGRVNVYLQQYLKLFRLQSGDTIFMPLCGKAVDILWLSELGFKVVGVELSRVAVEAFFDESGLEFTLRESGKLMLYEAPNIALYQGDFMHLEPQILSTCKLVYDRASIVAIELSNRVAYKKKMLELVPVATPMLMVTLSYNQRQMAGPPFSVPVNEITELYQPEYQVEMLQSCEQIDERPRWKERGLESLIETALRLTPL
jgi:thiopurine S-methyltransferase